MKKGDLARASMGLGTAALLGLAGCAKPAPAPAAAPTTEPAVTGEPAAAEPAPPPAAAPDAAPAAAGEPDCQGADRFTEACGYASPTRYAVLDPARLENA